MQGRGRERGRERIPSRLCIVSEESNSGLKPTNHKIMTWAEIKSQILNQQPPRLPETLHFVHLGIIYMNDVTITHCEQNGYFYIILLLHLALILTQSHNRINRRKKEKEKKKRPGQDYPAQNSNNGSKGLNWRTRLPSLMLTWKFNRIASYNFTCIEPG